MTDILHAALPWLIGLPLLAAVVAFAAIGACVCGLACLLDAMFPGGVF